jgi:multicomponent Na+:H+ antiporter subunit D
MSPEGLTVLAPAIPLVGTLAILAARRHPNLREGVTLITAVSLFVTVLALYPVIAGGGRPKVALLEVIPGLALSFEVEPLGMLFALVASGLWIVTSVYSIGYMRAKEEGHQTRFFAFFALSLASTVGIAFSGNLLTLFVFYEALTLATYPLVTHHGTPKARKGGRTYLGILLTTSIGFLLVAIVWTWHLTGTLEFRDGGILQGAASPAVLLALLVLYAFGTGKAALMPFHRWLPAAMVAPTPVSALLHAVAVVKAGVFTILKVVVYVFGLETLQAPGLTTWLLYVAAFTILAASVVALTRDNLKARLAYSTVSQLSYIVLAGLLANHAGLIAGGSHIAMHAFGKITLFFCAGAIYVAAKKTEISTMDGLGRRMPLTYLAFFVGSLSVAGLPPTGGTWSKWYLLVGALEGGHPVLLGVLALSTLLNVAYLMPIVARGFFLPPEDGWQGGPKEAPILCLLPLCFTALGCVLLFFFPQPIIQLVGLLS